jgi:hypothetical protein
MVIVAQHYTNVNMPEVLAKGSSKINGVLLRYCGKCQKVARKKARLPQETFIRGYQSKRTTTGCTLRLTNVLY